MQNFTINPFGKRMIFQVNYNVHKVSVSQIFNILQILKLMCDLETLMLPLSKQLFSSFNV